MIQDKKQSTLKKLLLEIGFSERQCGVYLALLKLGRGTVSEVARLAGINRTTGYDILSSLVEKGLVSVSGREPKQEFVAESPDQLSIYLEQEKEKMNAKIQSAQALIPQLKSMHNAVGRPKVMFYEGKEGLERVYEDTLTSTETIRAYANVEDMHATLPKYFPKYYQRRTEKKLSIRAILPDNAAGQERAKHDKEELRQSALVSHNDYYFSPEINIYDNKVMIASWKEKLGIIIESKEIAEAMKSIYELAWAEAKRLDNKKD